MASRAHHVLPSFGAMRWAFILAGVVGLSVIATQFGTASTAHASPLRYQYQHGYYLDNGWLCYGWSNGVYHCTQHWHRANGKLISDHASWVPNSGTTSTTTHAATHATTTHATVTNTSARPAVAAPVVQAQPVAAAPSGGSVQSEILAVFGAYGQAALNVARCESGFNPNATNPSSGAAGIFQFLPSTWATTAYAGYSPYNASANIHAAYQVFSRDGYSWREWVCQP